MSDGTNVTKKVSGTVFFGINAFMKTFYEIEEILTITHYCYKSFDEIQGILTIYITRNQ